MPLPPAGPISNLWRFLKELQEKIGVNFVTIIPLVIKIVSEAMDCIPVPSWEEGNQAACRAWCLEVCDAGAAVADLTVNTDWDDTFVEDVRETIENNEDWGAIWAFIHMFDSGEDNRDLGTKLGSAKAKYAEFLYATREFAKERYAAAA